MTKMFDILSVTLALGCLAVLSLFLLAIIIYTWHIRRTYKKLEFDLNLFFAELDGFLEKETGLIPDDFFSGKASPRYHKKLLAYYIQRHCFAKRHPHSARIKEYAKRSGLLADIRERVQKGNYWDRAMAVRILAETGVEEDMDVLMRLLETSASKPVVYAASVGLANHGIGNAIRQTALKLYDSKRPNRDEILSVLSCFDTSSVETIVDIIKDDTLPTVLRATIVDLIGVKKIKSAKDTLEQILNQDSNSELNVHVIEGLEKVGDTESCIYILPYLKDEDFRVRLKAVNALERLADDKYMKDAEELLVDRDLFVRRNAAEAISRMGTKGVARLNELKTSKIREVSVISKLVLAEQKYGKIRWRFRYGDSIS